MNRLIFKFFIIIFLLDNLNGQWETLNDGENRSYNTINFVNEDIGWIGGDRTLLKTEDGGETWISLSASEDWDFQMIDFFNEYTGWAIVEDRNPGRNLIVKSADRGKSWHVQKNLDGGTLNSIFAVNDSELYAFGDYTILKSQNGGQNWEYITPDLGEFYKFKSAWFFDNRCGIVSCDCGSGQYILLMTEDGGATWEKSVILGSEGIGKIQFINESTGYFLAGDTTSLSLIYKTTDAGKKWLPEIKSTDRIFSYFFIDEDIVYILSSYDLMNRHVKRSTDGGLTWEQLFSGPASVSWLFVGNEIYFPKQNAGYVYSQNCIAKSDPHGNNWQIIMMNFPFNDVYFIDKDNGWINNANSGFHIAHSNIFATKDGGKSWHAISTTLRCQSFQFLNESIGYALMRAWLGAGYGIYKTIDGGANWIDTYLADPWITPDSVSFSPNDIFFRDQDTGWAVGNYYLADSSGVGLLGTIDGGEKWDLIWKYKDTKEREYRLGSIILINNTLWGVGNFILKYTNQDDWQVIDNITDLPLNEVFFSDENHGWIAGGYVDEDNRYLILLKTTDGGETWYEIQGFNFKINDMFFEDSLHGWAVGNDSTLHGIIFETINGGETWTTQIGDLPSLSALHFKDGIGWAVGDNGLVLRTDNWTNWIDQNTGEIYPSKFRLSQNYPNPFNPSTKIKFSLPLEENIRIDIYNTIGQKVKTILDKRMTAGNHEIEFNAQNLSSGIYLYRIEAGEFQDVKKMVLIK